MTTAFIEAGVTELTHIADVVSANLGNAAISGSAAVGDLAVLCDVALGGSIGGGTPSGWQLEKSVSGSGGTIIICTKVLEAGDLGATIVGLTGTFIKFSFISIFRPDDDIEGVTSGSGGASSGTGNRPGQTVAAASQDTPVLVVGGMVAAASPGLSSSPGFGAIVSSPGIDRARFGHKTYNASPADHTISASTSGASSCALVSCYIKVS